jgi:hypothetical protein
MNLPIMPEQDPDTKEWLVPDSAEFVRKTGWVDGRFMVCTEIQGVTRFTSQALAITECLLLCELIRAAQEIEAKVSRTGC